LSSGVELAAENRSDIRFPEFHLALTGPRTLESSSASGLTGFTT
jgi:hypothetical protein